MVTLSVVRHARAPVERTFRHATDLRRVPEFIPAIRSLEVLTEGPIGVGTRFRETRVVFGREHTEEMEVTEFDAPRSYAVGCESCGCLYSSRFDFRAKDGGTEIEMTFEATPRTLFARVMGFLTKPMMKKMVAECAKDVDAIVVAAEADRT